MRCIGLPHKEGCEGQMPYSKRVSFVSALDLTRQPLRYGDLVIDSTSLADFRTCMAAHHATSPLHALPPCMMATAHLPR